MFIHTRSSVSNMSAKFGWKTRTFCHQKVAKVIAKLESDYRPYNLKRSWLWDVNSSRLTFIIKQKHIKEHRKLNKNVYNT